MSKYLPLCCNDPDMMRDAAAKICKDFLHGAWKTVSADELIFQRISGGLSNFLYLVALPEIRDLSKETHAPIIPDEERSADSLIPDGEKKSTIKKLLGRSFSRQTSFTLEEPKKVLIRIYGQTQSERGVDNIIMDSVIFTLLSERRLGPRLHGVFSGGRIEEFIPARQLLTRELSEPAFSMKIAEKMAAIHSMNVPLCKEPQWLWKKIGKWLQTSMDNLENVDKKNENDVAIANKLIKYKLDREVNWLKDYLSNVDSPVVFCHNDLQEGNILLRDDVVQQNDETNDDINVDYSAINHDSSSDSFLSENGSDKEMSAMPEQMAAECDQTQHKREKRGKKRKSSFAMDDDCNSSDSMCSNISDGSIGSGEPRLVLIDYEYCSYNHRGFDLANHFIEWAYDYTNPDYPYFYEKFDQYPSLEQKEIFMKQYLMKICGEEMSTVEEINHLNVEVEAYTLASHLFWTLWAIVNAPKSQIPFGYWDYALSRIEWYHRLKQDIVKKTPGSTLKRKIREVDI